MASKVQTQMINLAIKRSDFALAAHLALMAAKEQHSNGVFLDQAYDLVSDGMTPMQWSGALSALTKAGKYQPSQDKEYKGLFGYLIESKE